MFPLTSLLLGFLGSIVRHSFLSCTSVWQTAAEEHLGIRLIQGGFWGWRSPCKASVACKVLGSGNCESWPQRAFISPVVCRSQCGWVCPFSHKRPERALRLILFLYVFFMRNVFSCFIIIVLCGKGHLHRKWLIWWKYFSCRGLHLLPGTMLC